VRVSASSSKYPREEKSLNLTFDTDPERANEMKAIIYREIDKIAKNGPTQVDLDKVVESMLKNREQSKLHNNYWMQTLNAWYGFSINTDSPNNYETILKKMTTTDVQKFVQSFLAKADLVDVIFKPKP